MVIRKFPGGSATDILTTTNKITLPAVYSKFVYVYFNSLDGTARRIWDSNDVSPFVDDCQILSGALQFNDSSWSTGGSWGLTSGNQPVSGVEYRLLITYDGTVAGNRPSIYLNSVLKTLTVTTDTAGSRTSSAQFITFGNRISDGARCLDGNIAFAAIWNTILSQSDATALETTAPCGVKPGNLVHYWPMESGQSPEPNLVDPTNPLVVLGTTIIPGPTYLLDTRCRKRIMIIP